MKVIVTHNSPDLDAIAAIWLIKKFLPGWEEALIQFVPAGERIKGSRIGVVLIETINNNEVIHVDTGFGPLDHHDIQDENISATSLTWEYIRKTQNLDSEKLRDRRRAIERMIKIITEADHFKEVFWQNPMADYHEFSFLGILEGLKFEKPDQDDFYVDFSIKCLDAILHNFENRIWAEKEIAEKGQEFKTRWGEGLGVETVNDAVLKLGQKMGYTVVVRKDPRKGYIRIKAKPSINKQQEINLTLVHEQLKKMDPDATWFLHISKKMLLNGTPKNPKMKPTKLSLDDIIEVLKSV